MNDLNKIFFLTNKKEKYKLAIISGLNFFGIFLEMLSFALIIPVFNVIFLDEKSEIPILNLMHSHFSNLNINLDDEIYKILILLILILIFFSKNIFLIIINYISFRKK